MLKTKILALAALVLIWLPTGHRYGVLCAQDTMSPVGLENLVLRYRIYKHAELSGGERKALMDGIETFVQQHIFWQKMRVVRMEHEYEIWFTRGKFEWQWQLDDSPVTLVRVGGDWSFQGEKMAMNVDNGNCLMAAIQFQEFSIHRDNAFTPATVKILDFDIIECTDFAPGEGDYRTPYLPGHVEYTTWIAERSGVSIAEKYGTYDINRLAEIFAQTPLDQPLL